MTVTACNLEFRGIAAKTSPKTGREYCILNCEDADGSPISLYCPDRSVFSERFEKGDFIDVVMIVNSYNGNDRLSVVNVIAADI